MDTPHPYRLIRGELAADKTDLHDALTTAITQQVTERYIEETTARTLIGELPRLLNDAHTRSIGLPGTLVTLAAVHTVQHRRAAVWTTQGEPWRRLDSVLDDALRRLAHDLWMALPDRWDPQREHEGDLLDVARRMLRGDDLEDALAPLDAAAHAPFLMALLEAGTYTF